MAGLEGAKVGSSRVASLGCEPERRGSGLFVRISRSGGGRGGGGDSWPASHTGGLRGLTQPCLRPERAGVPGGVHVDREGCQTWRLCSELPRSTGQMRDVDRQGGKKYNTLPDPKRDRQSTVLKPAWVLRSTYIRGTYAT